MIQWHEYLNEMFMVWPTKMDDIQRLPLVSSLLAPIPMVATFGKLGTSWFIHLNIQQLPLVGNLLASDHLGLPFGKYWGLQGCTMRGQGSLSTGSKDGWYRWTGMGSRDEENRWRESTKKTIAESDIRSVQMKPRKKRWMKIRSAWMMKPLQRSTWHERRTSKWWT